MTTEEIIKEVLNNPENVGIGTIGLIEKALEMRRICKVNGLIILNANWNPNNLQGCILIEPIYISGGRMPFGNSAMIIRYIKLISEKERELLK